MFVKNEHLVLVGVVEDTEVVHLVGVIVEEAHLPLQDTEVQVHDIVMRIVHVVIEMLVDMLHAEIVLRILIARIVIHVQDLMIHTLHVLVVKINPSVYV